MACPAYQVSPEDAAYAEALSRYPKVQPRKHDWAATPNGEPQFEGYDDGLRPPADADDDDAAEPFESGRNGYGVQGGHLNLLYLSLHATIPCIWRILSA
jgi:hypothetical protein